MAMASFGTMRIELLTRDNYETWKIQMRTLLVKSDLWTYVGGLKVKPELIDGNAESREAWCEWTETGEKAKADLILCISPAELKQIKNSVTSREIWIRLDPPKGSARKATLLKLLIQLKMSDTGDVRDHLRKFFDIVDKLSEMEIKSTKIYCRLCCFTVYQRVMKIFDAQSNDAMIFHRQMFSESK
ncbi:hypothetical protein AVEN_82718-1 [Araneus ventricosus]|uniref:Uncharacterized protein n=1 Tax=Araneus ventricosus TaxID=182803 RepID=A0A4Y2NUY8_ARAVE|nr:hypothetical protein AVEN_82718-1 [Araneus ventricosus]